MTDVFGDEKSTQGQIYQKLIAVMRECPAIGKDSINKQQGFKYRGVEAVMNELKPLFSKHGVIAVPYVTDSRREERTTKGGGNLIYTTLTTEYRFYAEDGSYITACVQGEGMDSADKSSNKALAVAFKYACFQVLCIPTEEFIDPDAETPENSKPKSAPTPKPIVAATAEKTTAFPPKCSICGNEIQPKTVKGQFRTAYEVRDATGGLCTECYHLQSRAKAATPTDAK
ncbi:MAG TPA: ERF family protein [Clostridiales bacterium]|nr:ERF family protein [Clostridiales bacterium]